jgi:hypothetical protein
LLPTIETDRLRIMWTTGMGHDGPDEDFLRRVNPPENEIPVVLPVSVLLARAEDAAVALIGLQVYTTGVSFTLVIRVRPSSPLSTARSLNELVWAHGPGPSRFLLGIELSDGRRRTSGMPMPEEGGDLVFHSGSGSGGEASVEQSWWLSPLPPDGPLRFVVRCPELGIEETVTELDGSALRRAADSVVTLWPWEPPPEHRQVEPPPPDVPPGSWFAGPS